MGEMTDYILDSGEIEFWKEGPSYVRCKYCGTIDVHWETTRSSGDWRLYEGNEPHVCDEYHLGRVREKQKVWLDAAKRMSARTELAPYDSRSMEQL